MPDDLHEQMRREVSLLQDEIDRRFQDGSDALHEYIDGQVSVLKQRLNDIDKATRLLDETVNRVPTEITKEVTHLQTVIDERFNAVATQFTERDIRSEREARDNKVAVDAAFAAQKEAASEKDKSNTLAISKSETATNEAINKLAELFGTTTDALSSKIDDVKERILSLETRRMGEVEHKTNTTTNIGLIISFAIATSAVITLISLLATHTLK